MDPGGTGRPRVWHRVSRTAPAWLAHAGSAALPAYTAYKYAQFAHSPGWYDDAWSFALVTLFIAQIPVIMLGAVFAGVSYIEGPAWRRVLVYVILVAIIGGLRAWRSWRSIASSGRSSPGPWIDWLTTKRSRPAD